MNLTNPYNSSVLCSEQIRKPKGNCFNEGDVFFEFVYLGFFRLNGNNSVVTNYSKASQKRLMQILF